MTLAVSDFRNAIIHGRATALTYGEKLDALLIAPLGLRAMSVSSSCRTARCITCRSRRCAMAMAF